MAYKNIISQREALDHVGVSSTVFVDGSWYLPAQNRNTREEFAAMRIPAAVFFDIDEIADKNTDLPHMLPEPKRFGDMASALGIGSNDLIIVYDGPGLFSAPRVWWTLKVMGAQNVKILEGGFDAWKKDGLPVEYGAPTPRKPAIFSVDFDSRKVASMSTVEANLSSSEATTIDARPADRFKGLAPEPREGLRSGHIPGSRSLPANRVVRDGKLVDINTLERYFRELDIAEDTPVITTCGSGVTAAILALALNESGRNHVRLFDGSWAQWGKQDGPPVETDG